MKAVASMEGQKRGQPLSPAEQRVHDLIVLGLSSREIGARIGRSHATVRVQTNEIYRKLGVTKRQQLILRNQKCENKEPPHGKHLARLRLGAIMTVGDRHFRVEWISPDRTSFTAVEVAS